MEYMGLLNYLGGRGSSAGGEGSSRHVESDVGGVTIGGAALRGQIAEPPAKHIDGAADMGRHGICRPYSGDGRIHLHHAI